MSETKKEEFMSTSSSFVDGTKGELIYRGYDIRDLGPNATFEEVIYLLWNDKLPTMHELDLFKGRKEETLAALDAHLEKRSCKAGEKIFARGDTGDELFLIRSGSVRIVLSLDGRQVRHVGTFGRGDFFGEMAFLDGSARSADAVAFSGVDLFKKNVGGIRRVARPGQRQRGYLLFVFRRLHVVAPQGLLHACSPGHALRGRLRSGNGRELECGFAHTRGQPLRLYGQTCPLQKGLRGQQIHRGVE